METKILIENYINLISKEGFINEDENIYFKNIGTQFQETFYDTPDQQYIKQIKSDYIEGRSVNLIATISYSTLKYFEKVEELSNYIHKMIENIKIELTKEIICIDAFENLKYLIEEQGYNCQNIVYDLPYLKGHGFSYIEHPSENEYNFKHIIQTDFITISEKSTDKVKTITIKSDEIINLNDDNIIDYITKKLSNKK
ncbi:hypothetical protein [Elizabethkingia ursingii]|uniref:hypothetical protein n=1 Tax=Elizabethkingia ursingii TaxID=1756150 RepID=UPI00201378EB|nr:hypothetical protein [Elizabethkingia ursingii]MCL1670348.1 hypothetical protein [Elizabethkingia ursingii]